MDSRIWKTLIILALITIVTVALARTLSGSQTLAEYANEHPEQQVQVEVTPIPEKVEDSETVITPEVTPDVEINNGQVDGSVDGMNSDGDAPEVNMLGFVDEYDGSDERTIYEEGFYYEPIPQAVRDKMKGLSYPDDIDESIICYDDLRYLVVKYVNFDGETEVGELVCNKALAQDFIEVFAELYKADYRIEKIRLIDEYGADDTASMADNNTSCFCYRVVDGTTKISKHAYGRAIDINPFYNPYIVFKAEGDYISPAGSEIYADRTDAVENPYRIDKNDLAYKLLKERGFTWGGDWNSTKDYQHFQKVD